MDNYRIFSPQSGLTDSEVTDIRLMGLHGLNETQIAKSYGIHRKTVYNILNRKTWNHVPSPVRAYGFPDYLILPDGRVYSQAAGRTMAVNTRSDGQPTVRIRNTSGKRVTVPVSTLVARGYLGTRSREPKVSYRDGNPTNTHFTNLSMT